MVFYSKVDSYQKMRLLLNHTADVNITTCQGETHLQFSCSYKYDGDSIVVLARLLLEGGADVNLPNILGCTPVFEACGWGHFSLLRLLVEQYGAPWM